MEEEKTETSFKTIDQEEIGNISHMKFDILKDFVFFLQFDPPEVLYIIYIFAWFLWSSTPIIDDNEFWGGAVHFWEGLAFFKLNIYQRVPFATNQIITFITLGFQILILITLYGTFHFKSNASKIGEYLKALSFIFLMIFVACSFEIITSQVGLTKCESLDISSQTATLTYFPAEYCYTIDGWIKTIPSLIVIGLTFVILFIGTYLVFSNNPKKGFSATSSIPVVILALNGALNQLIVESLNDNVAIFSPLVFSAMNLLNAVYVIIFAPFFSIEANSLFVAQFVAKAAVGVVSFICFVVHETIYFFFNGIYDEVWFAAIGYGFTAMFFIVLILSLVIGFAGTQFYQRYYFTYK